MAPKWNLSPNPSICMLNLSFSLLFTWFWAQVFDHKTSWIFLFFKRVFWMWTIFKVFIEFFTILLLFYVLVFWPWGMWDLSSPTRDWTLTSCIGKQSLNHWVTREISAFFFFLCCLWFLSICRLKAKDKSYQGRGVMLRKLRGNDNV